MRHLRSISSIRSSAFDVTKLGVIQLFPHAGISYQSESVVQRGMPSRRTRMTSASPKLNGLLDSEQVVPTLTATSDTARIGLCKEHMIASYDLMHRENRNDPLVEDFCRALVADREDEAAFLTALLETFKVETRAGSSFLLLSAKKETCADVATRVREDCEQKRLLRYALARRLMTKRLPNDSDIRVRVVECAREREFIKIFFHLRQDEAKLRAIMTRLAIMDLGNPVKSFKGLICAAPCSEGMNDGENYARAVVVKAAKRSARNVKVRFLDFGFVDYVEKTSLRKLPAGFLKTRALAHTAVVVNTRVTDRNERQSQADRMMQSDETLIRVLKYNKERKFHEVYVYKPNQRPDVENLGLQRG